MENPWTGEVAIVVNGQRQVCKLTFGALASLEAEMAEDSLSALVARFDTGGFRSRDVLALLCAGLRAGGWFGTIADLAASEIEGGPLEAARVAARLLALAFRPPS
jgi:hypothetical protein